jgi:hypothetical protein
MTQRPAAYASVGLALLGVFCGGCSTSESDASRTPSVRESVSGGSRTDFTVFAHCGVEFATIDGETWRTKRRDDGQGNPPDGWPQQITGTLSRPSQDRAVFRSDAIPVQLVFRPAPHVQYVCY